MVRFIIVLLATFGGFVGLSVLAGRFPTLAHTVFNISTFAVTWVVIGTCLTGYAALKVSK